MTTSSTKTTMTANALTTGATDTTTNLQYDSLCGNPLAEARGAGSTSDSLVRHPQAQQPAAPGKHPGKHSR